jgi:hypothetical protein
VHCEKGEIYGDMLDHALTCNIFGKSAKRRGGEDFEENAYGHGGGDFLQLKDVASAYGGGRSEALTSIGNSLQSHAIAFAAELSRKRGGRLTPVPRLETL